MSKHNRDDTDFAAEAGLTHVANLHDPDDNIPLSSQAIFWPARHPVASPLLRQVPFLFWLAETCQPRKVVQLGLGDGLVYMALCQAAERLGGPTFCLGMDPGDSSLPEELRGPHNAQYSDISTLLPPELTAEASRLVKGADLLVLNTPLDQDLSRVVLEKWLPNLSRRAVVLICDPVSVLGHSNLRQTLLDETKHLILSGSLSPGGALMDVALYGPDQPERLRRLVSADDASAVRLAARQVFSRLGQGVENAWQLAAMKSDTTQSDDRMAALQDRIACLEQDLAAARQQADLLHRAAEAERIRAEAASTAELARRSASREERVSVAARLTDLESQLQSSDAASMNLRSEMDVLRQQKEALEAEHAARIEDIAVLMQQGQARLDAVQKAHQEEVSQLHRRYDDMIAEFHSSTSWRVTRPLRGLKSAFVR